MIVGGCGHVGLPFGIMLAQAGFDVDLYDIDRERAELVRSGAMPFIEYGADDALRQVIGQSLNVVDDIAAVAGADYVVITVGTPIDEYLNPRFGPLFDVMTALAPHLSPSCCIVLRSTVFPGTTHELARHLKDAGASSPLSYCPERVAQGYAMIELRRLPQLVSGVSEEAIERARELFSGVAGQTIVLEVEEAELAKLFLNSWRYIQFAISNQFFMMAEERGLDFFRIHDAMIEDYDRASDFPLPGFTAGPCLLKDTMQLAALDGNRFQLGHAAMLVNEGLAGFIVTRLEREVDLSSATVGILGMAFKRNVDDTRDSLAYKLRKLLLFRGARVLASDPLAVDASLVPVERLLAESDVIVIGAPHDAYRDLQIPDSARVVDVWGFLRQLPLGASTS